MICAMLPGIGVFGTGAIAAALVPLLRERGFKIEALWGRTLQEAEQSAKELNIQFYTNKIDEVLLRKNVDLIFIICPPYLHSQISVKALGIGKHVVCDKPAGLNQHDALKMVRACQYYPSLISILNHSLRFFPAFTKMHEVLQNGYLGDINDISLIDVRVQMGSLLHNKYDWLCDATMGGGILNLLGSHIIDLITFLTNKIALRVHGTIRTFTKTTPHVNGIRHVSAPDFCTFQMDLENGCLVTATLSSHIPKASFHQEVMLSSPHGHLAVRGGDLYGCRYESNSAGDMSKEDILYMDDEDMAQTQGVDILPMPYIKGLCKLTGALREAFLPVEEQTGWIKEPVQLAASFEDGLYVQAVLDAIKKSSNERTWVDINILTETDSKVINVRNQNSIP